MPLDQEKELREYKKFLQDLVASGSSKLFHNGGEAYAVELYSVLLANTKESARFYCQGCMSKIWMNDKFQDAFIKALENVYFHVDILTHDSIHGNLEWLPQRLRTRVRVVSASEETNLEIKRAFNGSECNFSMFDEKMFRFEFDVKDFKAYGSFNDPKITKGMVELFDKCFDRDNQFPGGGGGGNGIPNYDTSFWKETYEVSGITLDVTIGSSDNIKYQFTAINYPESESNRKS